jgi:hypothetical protein
MIDVAWKAACDAPSCEATVEDNGWPECRDFIRHVTSADGWTYDEDTGILLCGVHPALSGRYDGKAAAPTARRRA